MRMLLAAAALAVATPVLADTTAGTVFTYDEDLGLLIMNDRTIWQLGTDTIRPETLAAGDKVVINFTSAGDDGVASVDMISMQTEQGA